MSDDRNLAELADRFTDMCVRKWVERGLPPEPLAASFSAWGLMQASAEASPTEVAEGLQRLADEIVTQAPEPPKHLI